MTTATDNKINRIRFPGYFKKMSIKGKLVAVIMLVCSTTVILSGLTAIGYQLVAFRDRMANDLITHAGIIANNCLAAVAFDYPMDAQKILESLEVKHAIAYACVYRQNKTVLAEYRRSNIFIKPKLKKWHEFYEYQSKWLIAARPINFNKEIIGTVFIQSDLSEMNAFIKKSSIAVGMIVVAVLALAFILASMLHRVISVPVLHLTETAGTITRNKDYSIRATIESEDELGMLTETFNNMLEQIENRDIAIRESEERFRSLVESSSDWIWEVDKNAVYTYSSPKIESLLGYTPDEIIGKKPFDLMAPEETNRLIQEYGKLAKYHKPIIAMENTNVHRNGSDVIIETSGVPIFKANNEFVGYRGVDRDVTERKKAELILKENAATLNSMFAVAPTGIGLAGKNGYTQINEQMTKITGYSRDELLEMKPRQLYSDDEEYKNIEKNLNDQLLKLGTGTVETKWVRKDGETIDVLISSTPTDPSIFSEGITFTALDITERKRDERELRHLRNLLSNIVNSMPSVLIGVDKDGYVTQWNLEAENETGISSPAAHGQLLGDVFPKLAGEMDKVLKAIKERTVQKNEKIIFKQSGEKRFSDITIYPLVANGIDGAVIRVDDVTDKMRIEEMMIQSEKMLSVGGLAAGMAHEINNPLAGILQNVQVMRNRLNGSLSKNIKTAEACNTTMEAIEQYIEKRGINPMIHSIMESGHRAARIVDNMLSFSRKSEARPEYFDLGVIIDKAVDLAANDYDLKKKYDFRQIKIVREYDSKMPKVMCEESKIQQVLLNVFKNGAQAMTPTDEVNKILHFIIRLIPENDMVRIEIEDNGPGMDESIRKRVFEPFFTTKDVGVGTGLGLSVSYFIITENHGGTMAVESVPGKGTKFIIHLPVKKE